jgi:hypothetical protein
MLLRTQEKIKASVLLDVQRIVIVTERVENLSHGEELHFLQELRLLFEAWDTKI